MQVYLIQNGEGHYKIGYTDRPIGRRLKELQTASPTELSVFAVYETKIASKVERILHRTFRSKRTQGEWFALDLDQAIEFQKTCKQIESNLVFLENNKIGL